MIAATRTGATLVLLEDPNPFLLRRQRALELLEGERITIFPGVPVQLPPAGRGAGLGATCPRCGSAFSAGTALPRPFFDAFLDRFGVPVRQLYGCTEAGTLTANMDDDPVASFESVGGPVDGVEVLDRGRRGRAGRRRARSARSPCAAPA